MTMKYCITSIGLLLALACGHPLHAVDEHEEARLVMSRYNRFCPLLARALEQTDVEKLVELSEPAFRGAVSNDVAEFKLRFDGIRGSHVYCTVVSRTGFYDKSINSAIDSFLGKGEMCADVVDLMPLCLVSIRDEGTTAPAFDRLCVNTLLHKDGRIGIIGRIPVGRYTDEAQVAEDFEAMGKAKWDYRAMSCRRDRLIIMESELAWRLARNIKAALSSGNAVAALGEKLSPNGSRPDGIKAIEQLSAYRIREVIPYGSDEKYARNAVDAREGDRAAYFMVVMAEESPAAEVGWIEVIVGRDFSFRMTTVKDLGRAMGILPRNDQKRHDGLAKGSQK